MTTSDDHKGHRKDVVTEQSFSSGPITDDPFLCHCGPCRSFWNETFGDCAGQLKLRTLNRVKETSTLYGEKGLVKVGDRVEVLGKHRGIVKYLGVLEDGQIAPQLFVGVKLDEQVGSEHNGVVNGKRYFFCPRGHGAMVEYKDIRPVFPPEVRPPLTGNSMYPSYEEVKKRRKEREKRIKAQMEEIGVIAPPRKSFVVNGPSKRGVADSNDIMLKDARRREDKQRRVTNSAQGAAAARERKIQRCKEEFGGGVKAETMAQTLRKLYEAFDKGVDLHNRGEDKDSDADEEPEPTRDQKPHKKSVVHRR